MVFGSSNIFVSQQVSDPCYTAQFPTSAHVQHISDILIADFTPETSAQGDINQYTVGVLLVDRDAHCVHLLDAESQDQGVFVGACGFSGRVSNQAGRLSSRLNLPSSVVYVSVHHTSNNQGEVLVFHPCHNDPDSVCYLKCVLSNSDKCWAETKALPATGQEPSPAIYMFDDISITHTIISNLHCRAAITPPEDLVGHICVESGAFIDGIFVYTSSDDDNLYASNLTPNGDLSSGVEGIDSAAICAQQPGNCVNDGFEVFASAGENSVIAWHRASDAVCMLTMASGTGGGASTENPNPAPPKTTTTTSTPATTTSTTSTTPITTSTTTTSTSTTTPTTSDAVTTAVQSPTTTSALQKPVKAHFTMQTDRQCSATHVDMYERSTLENCAYVCSKNRQCSGFSYNSDTSACTIHDSVDTNVQSQNSTNCYVPGYHF